MRSIHQKRRAVRVTACTVTLAMALVCVRPRPARAELTIATVTAVVILVGAVGDALSKWKPLFGGSGPGSGPDLAAKLDAVKTAIINELRTQRNQAWRANVQTVFDNYAILGARPKADPSNEALRASTLETSKFAFNQYAIIVEDANDFASSYQLAPMFSVLTGVHAALTKMKGELNPAFPAQWGEYDIYLKRSMQASNRLIGTKASGCWPGYDPGKGKYVVSSQPGYLNAGSVSLGYTRSQIWKYIFPGRIVAPNTYVIVKSACVDTLLCEPQNPVMCLGASIGSTPHDCICGGVHIPAGSPCENAAVIVDTVVGYTGAFGTNSAVLIVRANINAILAVGGGDDRWDRATIPTSGALTDPWIDEPACGPFGPWAYPSTL
jgi:hypothetical protein